MGSHVKTAQQQQYNVPYIHVSSSPVDNETGIVLFQRTNVDYTDWLVRSVELAAEYNVSAERIRQLEKNAMDKIKVAMSSN